MSLLQSDAPIESIAFLKNSLSPQHPRVLVVVPTRNTARTLEETIRRIPAGVVDDLLVIDNGSTDLSVSIAEAMGLKVVRHYFDRGYGSSMKTAFSYATAVGAEVVAILHSDLQYPPHAPAAGRSPHLRGSR